MTTILEAARKYVALGYSIVPIKKGEKRPAITWDEYQNRLPTDNELCKWFENTDNQIGIVTGNVSGGLFILDFDGDEWKKARNEFLEKFEEFVDTLHVETGSGKLHIYGKCPDMPGDVTRKVKKCSNAEVEIRANNHQSLCPPSLHPSGGCYQALSLSKKSLIHLFNNGIGAYVWYTGVQNITLPHGESQMARYKPYNYDQMMMVPISLEDQLMPGTLEYAIHHVVEERLDLSIFDERYSNDETGRKAIAPEVLIKIVLFGYSRGMITSRSLERACRENITFMSLTCGQKPDHSTIAAFVSSMAKEIEPLFTKVLMVCEEEGLLGGTHFSLDGLKLSSNAAKEWSGTFGDLRKKQEALERKVKEAVREHRAADERDEGKSDTDRLRREKRIKRLKQKADRIEKFLAENGPKMGSGGKEIQSNVTDNESAKLTSSHGVLQGYNANAMVDEKHQIVVHAAVFGKGEDGTNMEPMLEGTKENLEAIGWEGPLKDKQISADTGYYSVKNLEACKERGVDAYVPDPQFRKRDVRFADAGRHRRSVDKRKERYKSKKRWFSAGDFTLDDRTGKLICPAGHGLYVKNRNFVTSDGYKAIAYQAPKTACRDCRLRSKCLRHPDTESRQVHVFYGQRPGSITDEMKEKIDTPEGRCTYRKRLGIVEPVFGNIRACKRMDRLTLRGRIKVNIQWMLYCLVHNIEKILNFGKSYAMEAAS